MSEINPIAQAQIDKIAEVCKRIKPKVVIWSLTYNHESYIRDALEGFIMQKTDFPFVVIVHEDASTDGTAAIIKEYAEKYPDIIFPIFEKENQYSKPNGSLNKIMLEAVNATGAVYMALCEGDDYWICKDKLQQQVDFLDAHSDYGLVHTNYNRLNQTTKEIYKDFGDKYVIENGYAFETLVRHRFIKTLTVLFRLSLITNLPKLPTGAFCGDAYIFYEVALKSKIHYIRESMCVYRLLRESASHSVNSEKILQAYNSFEILDNFYLKKANSSDTFVKKIQDKWTLQRIKLYIADNRHDDFVKEFAKLSTKQMSPLLIIAYLSKSKIILSMISKIWRIKRNLI